MASTVNPTIVRRPLGGDREEVATITTEGTRALLVFADPEGAGEFIERTPGSFAESEVVEVSPEDIEGVCANHGLGFVGVYGFLEPTDLSIVSAESAPLLFSEVAE